MADNIPEWQRLKVGVVLSLVIGVAVGLSVAQIEPSAFAETAGSSAGAITCMAIFFRPPEIKRRWFLLFMATLVIAHAVVLFAILWPVRYKLGKWDLRIVGLADLVLTLVLGLLVQRLTRATGKLRSDV